MLNAENKMVLVLAHVFRNTLEILTLDADQSASQTPIAIAQKPAQETNVLILVREFVDLWLNAEYKITLLFVSVKLALKAILSEVVPETSTVSYFFISW